MSERFRAIEGAVWDEERQRVIANYVYAVDGELVCAVLNENARLRAALEASLRCNTHCAGCQQEARAALEEPAIAGKE